MLLINEYQSDQWVTPLYYSVVEAPEGMSTPPSELKEIASGSLMYHTQKEITINTQNPYIVRWLFSEGGQYKIERVGQGNDKTFVFKQDGDLTES